MTKLKKLIFYSLCVSLSFITCQDPWEEHTKLNDDIARLNIMELIADNSELSAFKGYLESTGWDAVLASTKSYTVWAPTNSAMSQVDNEILNDTAKLKKFVANHICYTRLPYYSKNELLKVETFAGKYISIDNKNGTVEDASLIQPYDILANNGILHIIDKPLVPKPNLWEFIETTDLCPEHAGYLNSLTGTVFDPTVAVQTGVDPVTGEPVYDTATGLVWNNYLLEYVRDLRKENLNSTVVLITDDVFDEEFNKFSKYYDLRNVLLTDSLTKWQIAKDLVFAGRLSLSDIQDTLISLYQVKVPFNKNAVEQTYEASNGVAYMLSDCSVRLEDKIHTVYIQGEDTNRIIYIGNNGQTGYTREKNEAMGGFDFILDNHNANPGNIKYYAGKVCATTYKFYWKAVNDFDASYRNPNPDLTLIQKLQKVEVTGTLGDELVFGPPVAISPDTVYVSDTLYTTAREVFLGQFLFSKYQDLWLQVTGGGNNMTITLDYLKLVPVLE
jgi:uncharacterized surface protein with fasciclin (FAS1) repeats